MPVRPDRIVALSQYMNYLASSPEVGDAAVRALVIGALAPVGATAGNLYLSDGDGSITLSGSYGFSPEELDDFHTISLSLPFPLTVAFNTREPVIVEAEGIIKSYPLFAPSRSAEAAAERLATISSAELVSIPLLWQGVCIGVVGLVIDMVEPWDPFDHAYLQAACNALTLWIVGRAGGSPAVPGQRSARSGRRLTQRQLKILELIAQGKSNAAIARSLGYSVSTVKVDIAGLMSTLGASNRRHAVTVAQEFGLLG